MSEAVCPTCGHRRGRNYHPKTIKWIKAVIEHCAAKGFITAAEISEYMEEVGVFNGPADAVTRARDAGLKVEIIGLMKKPAPTRLGPGTVKKYRITEARP